MILFARQVFFFFFFSFLGWGWVHFVHRPITGLFCQPRMIDDECATVTGLKISKGNWSTLIKPASVSLSSPQIIHNLTWARIRVSARWEVGDYPPKSWHGQTISVTSLYFKMRSSYWADSIKYPKWFSRVWKERESCVSAYCLFQRAWQIEQVTQSRWTRFFCYLFHNDSAFLAKSFKRS
jgi:hypothetical protein